MLYNDLKDHSCLTAAQSGPAPRYIHFVVSCHAPAAAPCRDLPLLPAAPPPPPGPPSLRSRSLSSTVSSLPPIFLLLLFTLNGVLGSSTSISKACGRFAPVG